MTTQANAETGTASTDAQQVGDYLATHPDFFEQRPELLGSLRLSHPSGKAVSLIERQVQVLREQNEDLKKRLLDLIEVARDNDRLSERVHRFTLELIKAGSLTQLLDSLDHSLKHEFAADAIVLHLPSPNESLRQENAVQPLQIDDTLKALLPTPLVDNKPQCGRPKREQADFVFGDQASVIESCAIIPLGDHAAVGLLSIGSREVNRFNPCMGTLFLSHLGELVARLLERYLP